MEMIPWELSTKLDRELEPGERALWSGQPKPTLFKAESIATFLFGIPWTCFAVFWICGAANFTWPDLSEGLQPMMLFPLFGVPFVIIGLLMLASPLYGYRKALKTLYAVTNKRAIIIECGRKSEIKSFYRNQITSMIRREKNDGSGDLIITHQISSDSDGDTNSRDIGFFNISGVKEVETLLKKILQADDNNDDGWRLRE